MRINHNTSALNTHRNLTAVDKRLNSNLEHLSSGEAIVRAADGPASLMISEQMRGQIASVTQAIRNSETSVSMVQTTEASLNEVNHLLVSLKSLAIHAANEGANDTKMMEADQLEVDNVLQSIDRISQFAMFGSKKLLDGSRTVNGVAAGEGLVFLNATTNTKTSPDEGYAVRITQGALQSEKTAERALTQEDIDSGVTLTLQEGGKVASYQTKEGENLIIVKTRLQRAIDVGDLKLEVDSTEDGELIIRHKEYGSEHSFVTASTIPGVLAEKSDALDTVQNGMDVAGTINGQLATGMGRVLTAEEGTVAQGLQVLYSGFTPDDPKIPVGRVNVTQNSLVFQIGPSAGQRVSVGLGSVSTRTLGKNVTNESGFRSLNDITVLNGLGAEDTLRLVDKALEDVNVVRARLGAVQKNALESNIRALNITREELTNSESVLRDVDMAAEVSDMTRNQIIMQASMAMLGQANQTPRNVLTLLQGG